MWSEAKHNRTPAARRKYQNEYYRKQRESGKSRFKNNKRYMRNRRARILERDGHTCRYCRRKFERKDAHLLTLDHVLAKCNGGTSREDNLVAACRSCNCSKALADKFNKPFDINAPPSWLDHERLDTDGQLGE